MEIIQRSDLRILIAEDETRLLQSMQFMLKGKGYTVYGASSGTEALAIISKHHSEGHPIDLLITDYQMSGMNGEVLIQAVRTFDIKMRILVVTAFGNKDLVVRLMRLGCRDFMDKPFGLTDLEKHIETILDEGFLDKFERKQNEFSLFMGAKVRSMVHDLNNLMTTTLVYADLSLKEIDDAHPARKKLTKMLASAEMAAEISTKLMQIKKEATRSLKIDTDMEHLVHNIATVLHDIAPEKVVVRSEIHNQNVCLHVDPERFNQSLLNLGMNAFDAMPNGGTLTFSLIIEESSPRNEAPLATCVCISVADTGHGMSQETLQKIYAGNFTTKVNGNGVGLQTVKSTVKDHDGWMKIRSEVGKGSEFKLYFPIQRETNIIIGSVNQSDKRFLIGESI